MKKLHIFIIVTYTTCALASLCAFINTQRITDLICTLLWTLNGFLHYKNFCYEKQMNDLKQSIFSYTKKKDDEEDT